MSEHLLIAPALDYRLTNGLHSVSGGRPNYSTPVGGKHFKQGDVIYTHPIQALNTNFLFQAWEHAKFRGDMQLPTTAPVTGTYFLNRDGRYGPDAYSPYDENSARKVNALAQTFDEAKKRTKPFAFMALTSQPDRPSGLSVHYQFFDYLEENSSLVEKWLRQSDHYVQHNTDFWNILGAERRRMETTDCVSIPIEGQSLE